MKHFSLLKSVTRVKNNANNSARSFSLAVRYHKNGNPQEVYKLENVDDNNAPLAANEVSVKFLAAPINPSDFNLASGTYGIKPAFPAVGGNEGVAVVQKVGSGVQKFKVGDWVLPGQAPFGTWRQVARAAENNLVKIPNDIPAAYAATLAVNPGTAYRLLRDFVKLQPGDVIVQNGANSMVGLAVIQMARLMGVKTINVVRSNRPNLEETLRLLSELGGDINIPDSYLASADFQELVGELPAIKLALNCIGGESLNNMARVVGEGAIIVTYGRMNARAPAAVPHDLLVYKQLQLKGFWVSKWFDTHSIAEREEMLNEIAQLVRTQQLTFFYELCDFDDFPYALKRAQEPYRLRKLVLNMDHPDRLAQHDSRPESDYDRFDTYAH